MKHLKLFFALFAMLALGVGNAWAEETVVYTLTPAVGSNNAYADNCDITIDDITWNLTGNSTMIPWRIGGKNLTNSDRTLYSKTAMPHKVTKVEVTHGTNSTTVNSFKLIVASDANFSNVISTVDATFEANTTTTLACPTGADWTNAYYKFVYNVTIGSNNKYLQFSEAKFYGEASTTPGGGGDEEPEEPTPSTTNWVETAISDITSSDIVIVTMTTSDGTTYAMSNDGGTSAAPTATKVTVNVNKTLSAEPEDNLKWNITNSNGSLTIYPNGVTDTWLYCTSTNNGVRVGTNANKAFTIDDATSYLKNTATNRYLGVYNKQDWRCYTNTTGNTANQTLRFYKYSDPNAAAKPSTPILTPTQEFESETFSVEITAQDGVTIHYTTDGNDPTTTSDVYSTPLSITTTTTVKAIAVKDGEQSNVASATYTKVNTIDATCEEAVGKCNEVGSTGTTDKYRVQGYVTEIVYAYDSGYKNVTFWMAATKDGGQQLEAYRVTPTVDGDENVKVGDKVEVVGKLMLFGSTNPVPEFIQGSTYTIKEAAIVYNVTIVSENGTVTATPMSGIEGTEVTLTVEPASGWLFDSWTVKDENGSDVTVSDNKFTMPASNVTVTANYTASEAPDAVLTLMANGEVHATINKKVGEKTELPATIENDCKKVFVGWDANENCNQAPTYAPSAEYTLEAENQTLYAVYATETAGSQNTSTISIADYATANSWADATKYTQIVVGDITASVTGGGNTGKYYENGNNWRLYQGESATITIAITEKLSLSTIKFTYTVSNSGVLLNGTTKVTSNDVVSVNGSSATFSVGNTGTATNGQVRITAIEVVYNSAPTYSDFSTTCTAALAEPTFSLTEGEYNEAKTITISATEGEIYYTLDGNIPTKESTPYTEAIVLDECGTTTIKAIAISSDNESPVASATYTIAIPIPANSEADPYTEAEAIEVYDSGCYDGETVYVVGTVAEATYDEDYGNYTIVFVNGFQCYRLQETATDKFTEDKIGVGDEIVVCGTLSKYNSNYQLAAGCYVVKHTPSVKADAELAWNPATVTLTVGDAFTAPTLSNPYSVAVTYESSNNAVATVSAEGVIAIVENATGTATITAKFGGDDTYNPAEVSCTIKVKELPDNCDGTDDFETLEANTYYDLRQTTAGWIAENAAVTEIDDDTYIIINGKTSAVGTITSPVLNDGIGSIKIRYANTYSEDNGVSFRLDIKQNDAVVKTYTITKANDAVVEDIVYTELIEDINVAGDFQMVFTNLSPTNSTSNKDRVSIGRLCWTNYTTPQEPEENKATVTITDASEATSYLEGEFFTGAGEYNINEDVTVTATAPAEWTFAYWMIGEEIVSYDAQYTFTVTGDTELKAYFAQNMSESITNLEIDFENMVIIGGPGANFEVEVYLAIGDQNADGGFDLLSTSSVAIMGTDATFIRGYIYEIDPDAPTAKVVTIVEWGGTIFAFDLDMSATPIEATSVTLSDGSIVLNENGAYELTADWNGEEVLVELGALEMEDWVVIAVGENRILSGMATVTNQNGVVTLSAEGLEEYNDEAVKIAVYNLTITATINIPEVTVYFIDVNNWGAPINVYACMKILGWGNKLQTTAENASEPGVAMTKENDPIVGYDVYSYTTYEGFYNLVKFSGSTSATEEVEWTTDKYYIHDFAGNSGWYTREEAEALLTPNDPDYTREGLTAGNYGTICLPNGSSNYTGAEFYEFVGKEEGKAYLASVTTLEAGVPYIFRATASEVAVYSDGTTAATPGEHNGLVGTFTDDTEVTVGNYILFNNAICEVTAPCWVNANRAYIVWDEIPAGAPQQMPGRRYIGLDVHGENGTTGLDNIMTTDAPVKAIENGQLIIIRNGEKYNVQGVRL